MMTRMTASVAGALIATLMQVTPLGAQTPDGGSPRRMPLPQDWSHRHLIYSAPTSAQDAVRLQNEPRYWHQWVRRHGGGAASIDEAASLLDALQGRPHRADRTFLAGGSSAPMLITSSPDEGVLPSLITSSPNEGALIHRDWGTSLSAGGTVGNEMSPAKFSFDVSVPPDCVKDFVVYNTSLVGAAGHPSIIAYNQLYSTQGSVGGFCNKNGPSVMWSYKTNPAGDATGITATSPVLGLDGTHVIYVETRPSLGSILHILKWKSGQGTLAVPVAPDLIVTNWAVAACPVANSCIVNLTFNGTQPATNSSPFYDYSNDALYVGDDNGVLHKFTPVLTGTPREVVAVGGWPIKVHTGTVLSSPVFDATSGNVFVGDSTGQLSYVKDSAGNVGACLSGGWPCLGTPAQGLGGAIVDAPIVDSSTERVFAFDGTDNNNGSVYQFDTALSNSSQVTVNVGVTASGSVIHAGAFDNTYMTSVNGSGYLFVCGKGDANIDRPALHRITITNGIMSSTSDGFLLLTNYSYEECSPVTEVYNTAAKTDWLFFSVGMHANQAGCSNTAGITGCLMSLDAASTPWPPAGVNHGYPLPDGPAGGTGVTAATSAIVVDNVAPASYPQASSIYFSFLGNAVAGAACNAATGVGCAVKLTQSALQ
jgi:hypothetical protein